MDGIDVRRENIIIFIFHCKDQGDRITISNKHNKGVKLDENYTRSKRRE